MKKLKNRPGRFLSIIAFFALAMFLLAACSDPTPTTSPPTNTPEPTATLAPGETPQPTATPVPTATPTQGPPFYDGKTVRITVGFSPGGGFDSFARVLARHLGDNIPGNPNIIVQNQPGAGSLIAANSVYAKQPGTGLEMVEYNFSINLQAILGEEAAKFDPGKYLWLGDMSSGDANFMWIRGDHPTIKTMDDWKQTGEELVFGASGAGSGTNINPSLLQELGFNAKIILGYGGSADSILAMQRGEVDSTSLTRGSAEGAYRQLIDDGTIVPFVNMDLAQDPAFGAPLDAPRAIDFATNTFQEELARFISSASSNLRTFAFPPGTPDELVAIMRQAFADTVVDPEFIRESSLLGQTPLFADGATVQEAAGNLANASPEVLAKYKAWLSIE